MYDYSGWGEGYSKSLQNEKESQQKQDQINNQNQIDHEKLQIQKQQLEVQQKQQETNQVLAVSGIVFVFLVLLITTAILARKYGIALPKKKSTQRKK